jgi:autotransporter-associated beta strand protein
MKRYSPRDWTGGSCALVKHVLLMLVALSMANSWIKPIEAAERHWTGNASANWSNLNNWSPVGIPQNGECLIFDQDNNTSMNNDIPNLTVTGLAFYGNDYQLSGNSLTITPNGGACGFLGDISNTSQSSRSVDINCGLVLGADTSIATGFGSDDLLSLDRTIYLHVNGYIDLNGHNLTLVATAEHWVDGLNDKYNDPGNLYMSGVILGTGNISASVEDDCLLEFSGPLANTFQGTLTVRDDYTSDPAYRGSHTISFKQGGVVVNDRLVIPGATVVTLNHSEQIGDNGTVAISDGSQLLLNGFNETIGTLAITNVSADASPSVLDTGTGLLGLNGGIIASVDNTAIHPTIKGHLNLNGFLPFNINGGPQPGLEILASIQGNGFQKVGDGLLRLSGNNSFFGDAEISEGTVEARTATAFGQAGPTYGVELDGSGSLVLQGVAIGAEPLFVNSASSILTAYNQCSWAGPVTLNTTLNVIPVDATFSGSKLNFSGIMSGIGGLNLLPALFGVGNAQLSGPNANTFTGPLTVNCQLLELNKLSNIRACAGPLVVGGAPGSALREVRWLNSYQDVYDVAHTSASLTLYSNGFVNLSNHNEYFGPLTFNGGVVDSGASGYSYIFQPVTVNPTNVSAIINGNLAMPGGDNRTFIVGHGTVDSDLIVNAVVSGTPNYFVKQGAGTMSLRNFNTYDAVTLLQAGTLDVNNDAALGTPAGTVISGGATLRLDGYGANMLEGFEMVGAGVGGTHGAIEVVSNSTFNLSGSINLDAATTINVGQGSALGLNGNIYGTGPLIETGMGTLVLGGTAANTYSGGMTANQGTLLLNKPNAVDAVPGPLTVGAADGSTSATARSLNSYQISGNIYVNPGSLMDINSQQENVDFLSLSGSAAVQTGSGYLSLKTGADINVYPVSGSPPATITGTISLDPGNHHINVASGSGTPGLLVYATMSQYSTEASIEKTGPGVLSLNGNNSFQGNVQVDSGTLIAANAGALGGSAKTTSVINDGTLALDGGIVFNLETLVLNSSAAIALDSRSGSNTWNGPIGLYQPTGISVSPAGGYLQVLNSVSGPGGLTKLGLGTLQFWGFTANTYAGITTVSAGTLEAGRVNLTSVPADVVVGDDSSSSTTAILRTDREQQFSRTASLNVRRSGLFDVFPFPSVPVPNPTLRTVVGNGKVNLGTGTSLTVSNDVSCAFLGVISGPGAFNKTGAALMQLTGNNTYTGNTTISGGTLQVDGSQPQSAVQISGGARLQGLGTVGNISLSGSSSAVAPGDGPGMLTCSNFNANGSGGGSSLEIQLNCSNPGTDYDQLNVHGSVTFGNRVNLNASLNFSSWLSNTFTIINNDGTDPVTGTLNGLAQNATLTIGSEQFRISYTGGDGNDVVLTQISGLPLPTLSIESVPPGSVRLLWRTNTPTYRLQSNTNLTTTNWIVPSPTPVILGTNYVVTNAAAGAGFYRLINP